MRAIYILVLILLSQAVYARDTTTWGASPALGIYQVKDNDLGLVQFFDESPASFFQIEPINSRWRLYSEIQYARLAAIASRDGAGFNLRTLSLTEVLQYEIHLSRRMRPSVGFGFQYIETHFTRRHLVDSDGYLTRSFSDVDSTGANLVGSASQRWDLNHHWNIGAQALLSIPINTDFRSLTFGLLLEYK